MRTVEPKTKKVQQKTVEESSLPDRRPPEQSPEVSNILRLQQTVGNQAVDRMIQASMGEVKGPSDHPRPVRDFNRMPGRTAAPRAVQLKPITGQRVIKADGPLDPDEETEPSPEAQEPEDQGSGEGTTSEGTTEEAPPSEQTDTSEPTEEGDTSGTVPDIDTAPEEGRVTGEEGVEDKADLPAPRGKGNVVANLQVNVTHPKAGRSGGGKQDAVVSGAAVGAFSQPGGRAVSPFGAEYYEPNFSGISYAFAGGKCTINATLEVICPWGTKDGGRTNVASGTDAAVTKDNYAAIKADLAPGPASPYNSPRKNYYSQALVERHEKFHGTDDDGWTRSSGIGIVKAQLEAGSVAAASAASDVPALLNGARTKLISENLKWYKGSGATYYAYAGEIRAFGDGKDQYQKLADDVEKQGKALGG